MHVKKVKKGQTVRLKHPITEVRVIEYDRIGSVLVTTGPLSGWISVQELEEEEG